MTGTDVHVEWSLQLPSRSGRNPRFEAAASQTRPIPRISRLMALAIKFDNLIREGKIADYAALARLGHVSRARITLLMHLLDLAPDI